MFSILINFWNDKKLFTTVGPTIADLPCIYNHLHNIVKYQTSEYEIMCWLIVGVSIETSKLLCFAISSM